MAPPKNPTTGNNLLLSPNENWVPVTWMPHASLSQTSHVSIKVRSAQVLRPISEYSIWDEEVVPEGDDESFADEEEDEWKVRATIYSGGGIFEGAPIGLSCQTPASTVERRNYQGATSLESNFFSTPRISGVTHECHWETIIQLPLRWRDLPRDAYLLLEVLDWDDSIIYCSTLPFFSRYGMLQTGLQKVDLSEEAFDPKRTHGLYELAPRRKRNNEHRIELEKDPVWKASFILDQLAKFSDKDQSQVTYFGSIQNVPWLDAMEKDHCVKVLANMKIEDDSRKDLNETGLGALILEIPSFDVPVMHEETFYNTPTEGASGCVTPLDMAMHRKSRKSNPVTSQSISNPTGFDPLDLVEFLDYENENDNPVEDKYRTLAHDLLRGLVDPALKPDREQRAKLAAIIDSPSYHPTREEKDLLWRFRFSLVDNRKALTKFLLSVEWTVDSEVVQAAELLEQWRKRSPIEVTDALKLLGKHVAFQTSLVRSYAIDTLAAAPDAELRLYLLQLVQALKYEMVDETLQGQNTDPEKAGATGSLANFLIGRAAANLELANYLYWYLKVETQSPTHGAKYKDVLSALKKRLSETEFSAHGVVNVAASDGMSHASATPFRSIVDSVATFLNHDDQKETSSVNSRKKKNKRSIWDVLVTQDKFITGVMEVQEKCRDARGKKDAKEAELKSQLAKEGFDKNPQRMAFPLPSAPHILVNGLRPESAKMFKSALYPALIDFHVETVVPSSSKSVASQLPGYKVMVKTGDDLRQDQLTIQMIRLMDGLLKRAALDLCLTPYSVIAMSNTTGLVEFVDGSMPVSQILADHNGSILQFLQANSPEKGAKYDVKPEVMANYIRSCAGYCVVTYLLGVGDRHLDNVLIRQTGHFFHIDFGFLFGRDPKPLPPAFRLTREMVDGMGGIDSVEYRQFCSLSCQAFNAIRKSAGLVLNLLDLMSDAGIEDLSSNPSADAEGVIAKVEERFRLDLNDEQAERYFRVLINDCLAALAPRVMDVFHSFAVARR